VVTNESGKGGFSIQGMTSVLLNGGHCGWQWQKFDKLPYKGSGFAGYKFISDYEFILFKSCILRLILSLFLDIE